MTVSTVLYYFQKLHFNSVCKSKYLIWFKNRERLKVKNVYKLVNSEGLQMEQCYSSNVVNYVQILVHITVVKNLQRCTQETSNNVTHTEKQKSSTKTSKYTFLFWCPMSRSGSRKLRRRRIHFSKKRNFSRNLNIFVNMRKSVFFRVLQNEFLFLKKSIFTVIWTKNYFFEWSRKKRFFTRNVDIFGHMSKKSFLKLSEKVILLQYWHFRRYGQETMKVIY